MESDKKYLTYNEYRTVGGDIPEMSFNIFEYKAEKKIDECTFRRFRKISEYPKELRMCVLELISEYNKEKNVGNIVSESDGDYSVSYSSYSKDDMESNITGTIKTWLSNTKVNGVPVLYCGADLNEN